MPKISSQAGAEKWRRRLQGATQDIAAGIQRVTENPAQKAIAKQSLLRDRFNASIDSGKWAKGLNRVTLNDWKQAAINKGVPRIAQGAADGESKYQAFAAQFYPYVESVQQEIDAMPKGSLEDSIARSTAAIRAMAKFQRS